MGTGSSKDKENPDAVRNRRLREFEEELAEESIRETSYPQNQNRRGSRASITTTAAAAPGEDYFSQFIQSDISQKNKNPQGQQQQISPPKQKDPEVDAAIAELEETFKDLDDKRPTSKVLNGNTDSESDNDLDTIINNTRELSRSQSCGPLGLKDSNENNHEFSQMMGGPPPSPYQHQQHFVPKGRSGQRTGTPVGPPYNNRMHQNSSIRRNKHTGGGQRVDILSGNGLVVPPSSRRANPAGLGHLSRGQTLSLEGGANSAPPGVSNGSGTRDWNRQLNTGESEPLSSPHDFNHESWNYQPPKIEGFDIEKFREVNRHKDSNDSPISPITLRLPSRDASDVDDFIERSNLISNNKSRMKSDKPAYTPDEIELLTKLEREVY